MGLVLIFDNLYEYSVLINGKRFKLSCEAWAVCEIMLW
jgi:hypothetical protein